MNITKHQISQECSHQRRDISSKVFKFLSGKLIKLDKLNRTQRQTSSKKQRNQSNPPNSCRSRVNCTERNKTDEFV